MHLVTQGLDVTSSFFGFQLGTADMAQVEHPKTAQGLVTI